jgi:hypothetical protein
MAIPKCTELQRSLSSDLTENIFGVVLCKKYCTRWFKYDRDKLWLVYTQIVPVIFEPPCISGEKNSDNMSVTEQQMHLWGLYIAPLDVKVYELSLSKP